MDCHGPNQKQTMEQTMEMRWTGLGVQGWDPAVDPDVVGASGFEPADHVLTVLNETCWIVGDYRMPKVKMVSRRFQH